MRLFLLGGVALTSLVGCSDRGFRDIYNTDVFQQNRRNELDLLVVIDNSCSMVEEQENVASNFDTLIDTFATAEVNWQIAVTTTDVESERFRGLLVGGDDEIVLRGAEAGVLNRVEYDATWGFEEGVALQLDRDHYKASENPSVDVWCPAPNEYTTGSSGSPGEWNPGCDGSAIAPPSGGTDDGPRFVRFGDLLVTEIMADARGQDSTCEWFELTNTTDDTLELGGLQIYDDGNNNIQFPEVYNVDPYGVVVVGRSTDPDQNCGVPVDLAAPEGFSLQNSDPVIRADTEDADERFAEMIAQGTQGTGIEHGLEGARLTFTEPYYSDRNGAWLRESASLAILVVSDEDDTSPLSVSGYERFFKELKGNKAFRQDGWFTMNALVGTTPTEDPLDVSCDSPDGVAYYASRYIELAARTGGLSESICSNDFQPVVQNLGLSISGLDLTFTLKERPILDTLEVKEYEDPDEEGLIRELILDEDFTYDPEQNAIVFDEDQIPPAEHYITARYRPLATSSTADTDAGGGEE